MGPGRRAASDVGRSVNHFQRNSDYGHIREVIAFPLNQKAQDLLMQAPAPVPATRLRELHLKIDVPAKKA